MVKPDFFREIARKQIGMKCTQQGGRGLADGKTHFGDIKVESSWQAG